METDKRVLEVMEKLEKSSEPFPVYGVKTEFNKYEAEHPEEKEALGELFLPEKMAFSFDLKRDPQAGEDSYAYGPVATMPASEGQVMEWPSVKSVDAHLIEYWKHRASEARHPVLVSRYADLSWELSPAAREKRDVVYAHKAIDAYCQTIEEEKYSDVIEARDSIRRAKQLALSIGDRERLGAICDLLLAKVSDIDAPHSHLFVELAFDEFLCDEKVKLAEEQAASIVEVMERHLSIRCTPEAKSFDPFTAKDMALRLAEYYRREKDMESARLAVRKYGLAFERASEKADGIVAIPWLRDLYEHYIQYGMRDDADRIMRLLPSKAIQAKGEMKKISVELKVEPKELEKFRQAASEGNLQDSLTSVASSFVPDLQKAEEELLELSKQHPLQFMIGTQILGEDSVVAQIKPIWEDLDGRLVHHLSTRMGIEAFMLAHALDAIVRKYSPSPDDLLDYLKQSPFFSASREKIVRRALEAYLQEDYISFVHTAVPQIEHILRSVLSFSGGVVEKRGPYGGLQKKNLGDLLSEPIIAKLFGESVVKYLRVLLTDQRGWNIRHIVMHGLAGDDFFNRQVADRILHVLLLLAQTRIERKQS